ncbi:LytR C-terminal domain-containing protein [Arthrobacter sp. NPDC058130]|uniref:LytR C-terminal domain-containing protein n=1 Tax=Arthrobacter sp. NPDC058130 TaxID=3346353 RepID=UPI0036EF4516
MARKPRDITVLHGHRVVSGSELRATFVEQENTEDNPVRLRRRIVHGVVLVMLVGLLVAAIIVAVAIMNGQIKLPVAERSKAAAVSVCPAATYDYTPPEKVNVNIYNSTSRPGLARSVADQLAARKFIVGAIANTTSSYRGVALVVSGAAGQSAAFSVQRNVPGSDYFQDGRTDPSVDVIITGDFKELAKPELVDQAPGRLSCPREDRRIVDDSPLPVAPTATPATG